MEARPKDILLRMGGKTLQRTGSLAAMGCGGGYVEVPITFSRADASECATFVGPDGVIRKGAANIPRVEWVDLDGDGIRETPGLLLEGSRVNLVVQRRTFTDAAWIKDGAPISATGQSDAFGGSGATLLDQLDAATVGRIHQVITFTGDGTKAFALLVAPGSATTSAFGIWDNTASTWRCRYTITWTAGVPSLSVAAGAGDIFPVKKLSSGWYLIMGNAQGVVAANVNRYYIGSDVNTTTGTMYIDNPQAENAVFPSSLIVTSPDSGSTVTRAADSFTLPVNFGPVPLTVLCRMARPVHADVNRTVTTLPVLGPWALGTGANDNLYLRFSDTTNDIRAFLDATPDRSAIRNIPAGNTINAICQYTGFLTAAAAALDVGDGNGLTAFSSTADFSPGFGSQTMRVGSVVGAGSELYGVLVDLMVLRGLFTLNEALAVP